MSSKINLLCRSVNLMIIYILESECPTDTGGSVFDGRHWVLYWSDVLSEVAFVVPSPETYHPTMRRTSFDTSSGKTLGPNYVML